MAMLYTQNDPVSNNGYFRFPLDCLTSGRIAIPFEPTVDPGAFYVSHIDNFPDMFRVYLGYQNEFQIASGFIRPQDVGERGVIYFEGNSDWQDMVGHMELNYLPSGSQSPIGSFSFSIAETRISPASIHMSAKALSGLILRDGDQNSTKLTGTVTLATGNNFALRTAEAPAGGGGSGTNITIILDALDGSELNVTYADGEEPGTPITSINSVPVGEDGNFEIETDRCLDQESAAGGVILKNTCADPCCECETAEQLTDQIETINSQVQESWSYLQNVHRNQQAINLHLNQRG